MGVGYVRTLKTQIPNNKKRILWLVALLVAFGIGFAIGAALWEEDVASPGRSQPGPRLTSRARLTPGVLPHT